jgi:hypothetical protein
VNLKKIGCRRCKTLNGVTVWRETLERWQDWQALPRCGNPSARLATETYGRGIAVDEQRGPGNW